jgi:hypothetical protein
MKKKKVKDEDGYLGKCMFCPTDKGWLTIYSHQRRSCMGVILRRGTTTEEAQAYAQTSKLSEGEECPKEGTGQYRKLLQESLRCTLHHQRQILVTISERHTVGLQRTARVKASLYYGLRFTLSYIYIPIIYKLIVTHRTTTT